MKWIALLCLATVADAQILSTNNLVGYWPMESTNGQVLVERFSNKNGSFVGAPSLTPGKIGNAIAWNGSSQYGFVPRNSAFELTNNVSWVWWVKGTGNQGNYLNYGPTIAYNSSWASFDANTSNFANNNIWVYVSNGLTAWTIPVTNALDGAWHQIAWTLSGGVFSVYKDGILHASASGAVLAYTTTNNLFFGAYELPIGNFSKGKFDAVRMFSKALTAAEVKQLFYAETGGRGDP